MSYLEEYLPELDFSAFEDFFDNNPSDMTNVENDNSNGIEKIILSSNSKTIEVDEEFKLTFSIYPENVDDNKIVWSSMNANIASVNTGGVVKGVSVGETTIFAKAYNGIYAKCEVTVKKNDSPHVSNIFLNYSSKKMSIGDTFILIATYSPSNAVNSNLTWSSNNTSVATVDSNGKVTAKGYGNARIVVSSSNGKTANCDIIVDKSVCSRCKGSKEILCYVCNGNGKYYCNACSGDKIKICATCLGEGDFKCGICKGKGQTSVSYSCSTCYGSGINRYTGQLCSVCKGKGKFTYYSNCTWCYGSGKTNCTNCKGKGYFYCTACGGVGILTCKGCGGDGDLDCPSC